MNETKVKSPLAYLITFTTYGTWLHGNRAGSIWKDSVTSKTKLIASEPKLEASEAGRLKNASFVMDAEHRKAVLDSILEVCFFRNWDAYAVHVRTNHAHAVVSTNLQPEKVMNDFKVYATRALRKKCRMLPRKIWTRHGSTKYLWNERELSDAVQYVRDQQGKIMAYGESKPRP